MVFVGKQNERILNITLSQNTLDELNSDQFLIKSDDCFCNFFNFRLLPSFWCQTHFFFETEALQDYIVLMLRLFCRFLLTFILILTGFHHRSCIFGLHLIFNIEVIDLSFDEHEVSQVRTYFPLSRHGRQLSFDQWDLVLTDFVLTIFGQNLVQVKF